MIKGVIFDMDGVISDTQKLHSKVESKILKRYGILISPEEITRKYAGMRSKEFLDNLLRKQNKEYNINVLMDEKWNEMKRLASNSVEAISGAVNLIKWLHTKGLPLAVASGSNYDYVKTVLENLDIIQYFTSIISGDRVSKGKPDPESFLLASKKIDILPEFCLVLEDGISGMQAAKDANMKCIGLVPSKNETYPTPNQVISLSEITPDYFNKL